MIVLDRVYCTISLEDEMVYVVTCSYGRAL